MGLSIGLIEPHEELHSILLFKIHPQFYSSTIANKHRLIFFEFIPNNFQFGEIAIDIKRSLVKGNKLLLDLENLRTIALVRMITKINIQVLKALSMYNRLYVISLNTTLRIQEITMLLQQVQTTKRRLS